MTPMRIALLCALAALLLVPAVAAQPPPPNPPHCGVRDQVVAGSETRLNADCSLDVWVGGTHTCVVLREQTVRPTAQGFVVVRVHECNPLA
jgi:hypothetical protein